MGESPMVIVAVIALVNAIVTGAMIASLNALLGARLERLKSGLAQVLEDQKSAAKHGYDLLAQADKAARDARLATYTGFWAAVADITTGQRRGDAMAETLALSRLTEAKGRVLLHGSAEVVAALATFWQGGAALDTPDRMQRFARLVAAMRADAGGTGAIAESDVLMVLFGTVDSVRDKPDGAA